MHARTHTRTRTGVAQHVLPLQQVVLWLDGLLLPAAVEEARQGPPQLRIAEHPLVLAAATHRVAASHQVGLELLGAGPEGQAHRSKKAV